MNRRLRWGVYAAALVAILVAAHSSASDGTDDVEETVAAHVSQLREARAKWRAVGLAMLSLDLDYYTPVPEPIPFDEPAIVQEIASLTPLGDAKRGAERDQRLCNLDRVLRETVSCAFEAGLSFEEVQRVTQGLVKWEQWPDVFGLGYEYLRAESDVRDRIPQGLRKGEQMGQEAWLAEENLLIVGYRTREAPSGEIAYAFQNSLWGMDYGRSRFLMSAYAVAKGAEVHCSTFFINKYPHQVYTLDFAILAGFVECPGTRPWILMLSGPVGTWSGVYALMFRYDSTEHAWKHAAGSNEEPVRQWVASYTYDTKTMILRLGEYDSRSEGEKLESPREPEVWTVDFGESIRALEEKLSKPGAAGLPPWADSFIDTP